MFATAYRTLGNTSLRRLAAAAAIAFGVAAPVAFDAAAREFEPGDDHGQTFEVGDDNGGLVAASPTWPASAWPTTDDHGGRFHD